MTFAFYAALSKSSHSIRQVFARLEDQYGSLEPLANVMYTPISQGEVTHTTLENLQSQYGIHVMFDSGGYEVQVGNYEFDELYSYVLDFYEENRWGHRYVLPDHVPVTDDPPSLVNQKVNETISASRMCYRRLPSDIQSSAIAVIQGHTKEQITRCLNEYSQFEELEYVGFGSFSTSGISQGVNMLTREAFANLKWATKLAHSHGLKVHAFGIGGPTSIPLLYEAGVDSFDSTTWMRTGGYGNVFFPFRGRLNVSHRKNRGKTLTADELPHIKAETNHECPFCEDIRRLRENRWDRIMHNLIVTYELTNRVPEMSRDEVIASMDENSRYRKQLEDIHTDTPAVGD